MHHFIILGIASKLIILFLVTPSTLLHTAKHNSPVDQQRTLKLILRLRTKKKKVNP